MVNPYWRRQARRARVGERTLALITHGDWMGSRACSRSQMAWLLRVRRESKARRASASGVALGGAEPAELLRILGRYWPMRNGGSRVDSGRILDCYSKTKIKTFGTEKETPEEPEAVMWVRYVR